MTELDPPEQERASPRRRRTRPRPEGRAASTLAPTLPAAEDSGRKTVSKAERDAERGLRGLIGAGPTQVGVAAAMRARDASRPTEDDVALAEKEIVIVRRHYVPTEAAPFDREAPADR